MAVLEPGPESAPGPVASLRSLVATLLELLGTRAELAVVELREEGERRKEMLVYGALGALFLALGLLLGALFVVVIFWDTHRVAAIGGTTLVYLAIAAIAFARLRIMAAAAPRPFEATLRELAEDRKAFGGGGE
jgi:uncharacterized membrane protein YqjE